VRELEHGGFHLLFLLLSADYSSLASPPQTQGECSTDTFLTAAPGSKKYQCRTKPGVAHGLPTRVF
jgi:hypothetical protein